MTWEKKRVLVTVKAYPEKSRKHGTVVCTAGITDTGDWIRLYPMPYSTFLGPSKIQRYDWIEAECEKVTDEKLKRKESYRVRDGSVNIIDRSLSQGKVNGKVPWEKRNAIILPKIALSLEVEPLSVLVADFNADVVRGQRRHRGNAQIRAQPHLPA